MFLIIFLLALAGCLVYFAVTGPKLPTKAKLVDLPVKYDERGGTVDG